jgi:hypothetical protein
MSLKPHQERGFELLLIFTISMLISNYVFFPIFKELIEAFNLFDRDKSGNFLIVFLMTMQLEK